MTRFPRAPQNTLRSENMSIPRDVIPWYPAINEELCTDCGVCVEFCPHGVYRVDNGRTIVTAPHNCVVGCSNCESLCEPRAIRFPDMEAFAATVRALRAKYGQQGCGNPGGDS